MDDNRSAQKKLREDRFSEITMGALFLTVGALVEALTHLKVDMAIFWYLGVGLGGIFIALGIGVLYTGIRS